MVVGSLDETERLAEAYAEHHGLDIDRDPDAYIQALRAVNTGWVPPAVAAPADDSA